jgi:hypothetical protein
MADAAVPGTDEDVDKLRDIIDKHLRTQHVYADVRKFVQQHIDEQGEGGSESEEVRQFVRRGWWPLVWLRLSCPQR